MRFRSNKRRKFQAMAVILWDIVPTRPLYELKPSGSDPGAQYQINKKKILLPNCKVQ
jgi:hypothetical protein